VISAIAPAKINLAFLAGPLRPDGYHSVISIYQALDVFEKVSVESSHDWSVELVGVNLAEADRIPVDGSNLVIKAALELAKHVGIEKPQPMRFVIEKRVPPAAGMAGGSADAAASLVALNRAWGLDLNSIELSKVAGKIGSDVPFALLGGTALGLDTGIELTPLPPLGVHFALLVFSTPGLLTADVFLEFDRLFPAGNLTKTPDQVRNEYESGIGKILGDNSLEVAAYSLRPDLFGMAQLIPGKKAFVSGSGPTLFMLSKDSKEVDSWNQAFIASGFSAIVCKTSNGSAELVN
jgi:4-diphosphocytidyl-2C-methyl-D-erythritol kinase